MTGSRDIDLIGFFVSERGHHDAPLLSVEPGMTVLYGLNGAGKTRTLMDIRNFFLGVSSQAKALIRIPSGVDESEISWGDTLYRDGRFGDWFVEWGRSVGIEGRYFDAESVLESWVRHSMDNRWVR